MKIFISEKNAIIQIYMYTIMNDAWVREEFCKDFGPLGKSFCFFAGSQQNVKET